MKIHWRDDVRLERVTDEDGIKYAIPVTPDRPLSQRLGFIHRQREREAVRAEKSRERMPKHAPIRRQLIHQGETA